MKKQTAVEWFVEQFDLTSDSPIIKNVVDQAKAMEKEQHYKSYRRGNLFLDEGTLDFEYYFEQYYKHTYGN
jgi:hypothetical protein